MSGYVKRLKKLGMEEMWYQLKTDNVLYLFNAHEVLKRVLFSIVPNIDLCMMEGGRYGEAVLRRLIRIESMHLESKPNAL